MALMAMHSWQEAGKFASSKQWLKMSPKKAPIGKKSIELRPSCRSLRLPASCVHHASGGGERRDRRSGMTPNRGEGAVIAAPSFLCGEVGTENFGYNGTSRHLLSKAREQHIQISH